MYKNPLFLSKLIGWGDEETNDGWMKAKGAKLIYNLFHKLSTADGPCLDYTIRI